MTHVDSRLLLILATLVVVVVDSSQLPAVFEQRINRSSSLAEGAPLRFLKDSSSTDIGGYPGCRSVSKTELELWELVNEERAKRGKGRIRLSRSLTATAYIHADNANRQVGTEKCNLHSWMASAQGDQHYKSCCYKSDHSNAPCMHWKPNEVTEGRFPSIGYEVALGPNAERLTAQKMLTTWFNSEGHRTVILEEGMWEGYDFQAIGVAARGDWAFMWFASNGDPLGFCGSTVGTLGHHSSLFTVVLAFLLPITSRCW